MFVFAVYYRGMKVLKRSLPPGAEGIAKMGVNLGKDALAGKDIRQSLNERYS